ncbi:MAG: TIR domain-containing protein [Methanophagales archaeon]|nr:TIR domain-containing protein [Methanophagales archaeon]
MENREESVTKKRYRVFLSYASADKEIAHRIVEELRKRGIRVWFATYELQPGDSIAKAIEYAITASDYLVVLLSPSSVNSVWVQKELGAALSRELTSRDITLLPVVIADCEIPPLLASYQLLDLRTDFDQGVTRLVEQIGLVPEIDFSVLDWRAFENLIAGLLTKLGFKIIEQEWAIADLGVDIKAEYSRPDPFGVEVTETWLVEVKFYRQSRADLRSIRQLVDYMSRLPARSKGLLVTNGQLTSAARNWLASAEAQSRIEIRVIDGTELKRLLLQHKELVDKYFAKKTEGQDE